MRNLWRTSRTSETNKPIAYLIPSDISVDSRKQLINRLLEKHKGIPIFDEDGNKATQNAQKICFLETLDDAWKTDRILTNVSRRTFKVRKFFSIRYPTERDILELHFKKYHTFLGEFGND